MKHFYYKELLKYLKVQALEVWWGNLIRGRPNLSFLFKLLCNLDKNQCNTEVLVVRVKYMCKSFNCGKVYQL